MKERRQLRQEALMQKATESVATSHKEQEKYRETKRKSPNAWKSESTGEAYDRIHTTFQDAERAHNELQQLHNEFPESTEIQEQLKQAEQTFKEEQQKVLEFIGDYSFIDPEGVDHKTMNRAHIAERFSGINNNPVISGITQEYDRYTKKYSEPVFDPQTAIDGNGSGAFNSDSDISEQIDNRLQSLTISLDRMRTEDDVNKEAARDFLQQAILRIDAIQATLLMPREIPGRGTFDFDETRKKSDEIKQALQREMEEEQTELGKAMFQALLDRMNDIDHGVGLIRVTGRNDYLFDEPGMLKSLDIPEKNYLEKIEGDIRKVEYTMDDHPILPKLLQFGNKRKLQELRDQLAAAEGKHQIKTRVYDKARPTMFKYLREIFSGKETYSKTAAHLRLLEKAKTDLEQALSDIEEK